VWREAAAHSWHAQAYTLHPAPCTLHHQTLHPPLSTHTLYTIHPARACGASGPTFCGSGALVCATCNFCGEGAANLRGEGAALAWWACAVALACWACAVACAVASCTLCCEAACCTLCSAAEVALCGGGATAWADALQRKTSSVHTGVPHSQDNATYVSLCLGS
jgi:hypothetical protein